jgi:hypothetical protein
MEQEQESSGSDKVLQSTALVPLYSRRIDAIWRSILGSLVNLEAGRGAQCLLDISVQNDCAHGGRQKSGGGAVEGNERGEWTTHTVR